MSAQSLVRSLVLGSLAAFLATSVAWGQNQYRPVEPQPQPRPARAQSQVVPVEGNTPQPLRQPVMRGGQAAQEQIQAVGGRQGLDTNGAMAKEPTLPCPFTDLNPAEQKFLDQLLGAWEKRSQQIERYRCEFERWEYDPIFGPKDPTEAKTYANGEIKYAAPDKGKFEVKLVKTYAPPKTPEGSPEWIEKKEPGEHWVCDGKKIFEFDARKKQLIERQLPADMQGKAIVDGPLPFLFGAKADKLKARYWLRVITPKDVKGEYWLEAFPKYRADTQNFKMVHIILDEKEFLPKALQVFDPTFDAQKKPIRTVFTFNKREVNWSVVLESLNLFHREFYEPSTPLGWKKVVEPFLPEPGTEQPAIPTASKPPIPSRAPFKFK